MSAVWIEGTIPRRTLREGVNEEFLNATGVDLEVESVRDGVKPALKTKDADRGYMSTQYKGASYRTYQGIRLNLGRLPLGEFIQRHLQSI